MKRSAKTQFILITLLCGITLAILSCTKGKLIKTNKTLTILDTTFNIAGTKRMHSYAHAADIGVYDSTWHLSDTSIAFAAVNDSTIKLGSETLTYITDLSNDSLLYYWSVKKDSLFSEISVSYYFRRDSIVVDRLVLVSANGYVETVWYSAK